MATQDQLVEDSDEREQGLSAAELEESALKALGRHKGLDRKLSEKDFHELASNELPEWLPGPSGVTIRRELFADIPHGDFFVRDIDHLLGSRLEMNMSRDGRSLVLMVGLQKSDYFTPRDIASVIAVEMYIGQGEVLEI